MRKIYYFIKKDGTAIYAFNLAEEYYVHISIRAGALFVAKESGCVVVGKMHQQCQLPEWKESNDVEFESMYEEALDKLNKLTETV